MLSRIPVRVLASNPDEYQAIADVLTSGQAGVLVLAAEDERPLVALICPSTIDIDTLPPMVPALVLGPARSDAAAHIRFMNVPAALYDVFITLESMAQDAIDPAVPRHHNGWVLEVGRQILKAPAGQAVTLTDTETRLLAILFDAAGHEMDRDSLLQRVWGYRPGLDTHTLETHIYRLRQKIETNPTIPAFLMTTGAGYRLA